MLDGEEINIYGTDPTNNDTDGDKLADGREIFYNTDPFNPDTDGDGLLDGDEINLYKTDPHNPDTDGDGYSDGAEVKDGTDALDPKSHKRTFLLALYFTAPILSIMGVATVMLKKYGKK